MKLIDADLLRDVVYRFKEKFMRENRKAFMEYWKPEFELVTAVCDTVKEATSPDRKIIQMKTTGWIPCKERLPETGANVILTYRDTFHTHPSWEKIAVMPAWICNVDEEKPKGEWAIEGRLGDYIVAIENGIAWMPLPEPYKEEKE